MAERGGGRPANGSAAAPSFPPAKSQLYNANRPVYRPQPAAKRRRGGGRSCCCSCCLWLTFLLIGLVLLAAIAGAVFYFIYRPHRPSFSVTALRLSSFNLSSNLLSSRLDLNITAHNPNKRLAYIYDPISISASTGGVALGSGSLPGFSHGAGNTTYLRAAVVTSALPVDPAAAADLGKKGSLALDIFLESRAGVKVGGVRMKKIGVRVTCGGIDVGVPKGKKAAAVAAPPPSAYCAVKLRVKIWKWYL